MKRAEVHVAGNLAFAVLLISQLAATAGFMFVMPFMPLYVQRLGVEDAGSAAAWAGVLNTATALTMALAAPMWGRLADRLGPKTMLMRAAFAGSIVVGLMGLATSPWHLLVLRLVQGTLTGTVAAATVLASATAPQGKAGARLGTLQMIIFVAAAAGPFVGGIFAEAVGIRASFGVTAALLFLSGVLVLFGVEGAESAPEEEEVRESGPLPWRALLIGLIPLFFVNVAITGVAPALPGFVGELAGAGAQVAGLSGQILGAGALAAAVGSLVGGGLAARFGTMKVMVLALLLAGLASLPQAAVTSVAELFGLRIIISFALGLVIPVANLAVRSAVASGRQGEAFGVAASVNSAAFGLGPLGGGLLAASVGFEAPFIAPGILLLVASVALLGLALASRPRYVRLLRLVFANLVT
ncbi:MAG TPA: MFS transporter [Rubrobacteraceae bacterium]|nr:MFS transporter [Rubrobacteraceae bacterium]